MKVLIVPDKFKGTLTAGAAAKAIAAGWHKGRPGDTVELLPMSDGGDGFGEVTSRLLGARPVAIKTENAAHRPCRSKWWWEPESRTAIIESAAVIGLAMLPPRQFHPYQLDTFGLGAVLRAAAAKGARCCLLGIGGSATNDAGFGLARALGWEFLRRDGSSIDRWTDLGKLARIRPPQRPRWPRQLRVAVDVRNRLLGPRGATRVYGPQKGLGPTDFEPAEACLRRLAQVVHRDLGRNFAREPGAGAAGGLGFGLAAFFGASLEPGFELFAGKAGLDRRIRAADLVITGEGAIDHSTLMGKGVGQIAHRCRALGIPCLGLCGTLGGSARTNKVFWQVSALTDLTTPKRATAEASFWLERLAELAAVGRRRMQELLAPVADDQLSRDEKRRQGQRRAAHG